MRLPAFYARARCVLGSALVLAGSTALAAQSAAPTDTLAHARRLRDAGDYAGAAAILRPYVQSHPDDRGSARFAALMAYWAKDSRVADSIYADALGRHPGDAELRLEYARLLVDTRRNPQARLVLAPLITTASDTGRQLAGSPAGRAHALLGTLAYWSGSYLEARRHFVEALRLDSSLVDARRQLHEIATLAAPWVRVGFTGWDDDQPMQRATGYAEGAWFANPLTPFTVRARSTQFDADGASETVSVAEAELATYLPAARLDLGLAGGVVQRTFGDGSELMGKATLGIRAPRSARFELNAERAPYLNTTGSLATPIMVTAIEGVARWQPNGWMMEGLLRRERYPDDNAVTTAYAWALAPLVRRERGTLHAGYSVAAQSSDEGRFIPRGNIDFRPGQAPPTVPGKYDPYYTPRNLRVHSALASARLTPNERWTLASDVAYAVHARDEAPVLVVVPDPPDLEIVRAYYVRTFTPWNARGALDIALTEAMRLAATVEHGRRAFYRFTSFGVSGTYTFVAAARRRAERR